ncbi:immune-associated nucleotide-binding protein 3-like isoform X1 [Folsomia candida]|uniref:G domain-containing protein n=1 Tax=Folsomia candida TaxID=158441 RepID=A0A226DXN9_FOLCA|nr:immune-associated nucleotide-binding protein 3-like isoform X1 [Folsomia candida]OXA48986.1 putative protein PHLOEM PROTEIN 2-LIKE A3 [Folsomia candida]
MGRENNVVLFGESGSGKSSTVNLLLGQEAAKVSDRAVGCTFKFEKYATENYNLFDTVGLSEGSRGTMSQTSAVKQLITLLKSLEGGVSLLVFVMENGKITKSLDENYKLFVEAICMKKVPSLLLEKKTLKKTMRYENSRNALRDGRRAWKVVGREQTTF